MASERRGALISCLWGSARSPRVLLMLNLLRSHSQDWGRQGRRYGQPPERCHCARRCCWRCRSRQAAGIVNMTDSGIYVGAGLSASPRHARYGEQVISASGLARPRTAVIDRLHPTATLSMRQSPSRHPQQCRRIACRGCIAKHPGGAQYGARRR